MNKSLIVGALCALTVITVAPGTALADRAECSKPLESHYTVTRFHVKQEFGQRAAGRNIRRLGVEFRWHGGERLVRPAKCEELRTALAQLRALRAPTSAYLSREPSAPAQRPSGVLSVRLVPGALASCIIHRESRGDPRASNGSHWGIGQWTIEAWLRHGGGRFAGSPLGATYEQQLEVLGQGLARYGCRDWCPFDGC